MIKPHAGYHYRHGVLVPETTEPGPGEDRDKNRRPGVHAIDRGEIVGIALGAACAFFLLLALVYLAFRLVRKRRKIQSEYEKILPTSQGVSPALSEPKTVHIPNLSMRTIPFTVPTALPGALPGCRARSTDPRLLADQDTASTGSGSEPTTPSNPTSRGSMDSILSAGTELRDVNRRRRSSDLFIKGAYSLGSIDPSLYRTGEDDDDYDFGEGHIGRVWFAVEYERESEKLKVDVIKAKNLPSRVVGSINGCDPFCRIYLIPDERRYLQTKFKKKTCNPKFEESFVFQVSNRTVEERVLKLTVFDLDRHKRHNVIGHALFPLREHDFENNERVVIWRDIEREVSETTSDRGEIHVSLAYNNHLERLTVCVFEGKEFKKPEMSGTEEFYMKVCLQQQNKVIKNKRTDAVKRTTNPVFNESFTFKIAPSALDTASISINAFQHHSGQKDKLIGRVVFGSFMFARGKELDHWNEMIANQREQISHWHTLT